MAQFASLFGKSRIIYLMDEGGNKYNYYEDLCNEYAYLLELSKSKILGNSRKYYLPKNNSDFNEPANLYVIPSIEGAHVFCNGTNVEDANQWKGVEDRIAHVKAWHSPPLFVTLAHHFYNGLCTHAYSLSGASAKLLDQTRGMRDYNYQANDNLPAISEMGYTIISSMLDKGNGPRILVDVKHMSREARVAYYKLLQDKYEEENIPVLCSHGALTQFYNHEVNMELELDVLQIYKSHGLFGIEMDQRVLGYSSKNKAWQKLKNIFRRKRVKEHLQTEYVWKNIIAIAEFAYQKGFTDNPWKCICIGSDYDGIINPLNNYRDASCYPSLYNSLIKHLNDYWKKSSLIPKGNAAEVIYGIMYENAAEFIKNNYK